MKFFKPEHFYNVSRLHGGPYQVMDEYEAMAHIANERIERDSFPVYVTESGKEGWVPWTKPPGATHQALVINVESIHKCPTEYMCYCCGTSYKLIKK